MNRSIGSQSFRIAKSILNKGIQVIVLNPGDLATIYQSLKKTDKEDSLKIARLIQRFPIEELPIVPIPTTRPIGKRCVEFPTRPVERPMGSETLSFQSAPENSANASLRIGIQGAMH